MGIRAFAFSHKIPNFHSEKEVKQMLEERMRSIVEGSSKLVPHKEVMREMEALLRESENDFQEGRFESHSSICKRFGV